MRRRVDMLLKWWNERALAKVLEETIQLKVEDRVRRLLSSDSPWAKQLDKKMEEGLQRFMERGFAGRKAAWFRAR